MLPAAVAAALLAAPTLRLPLRRAAFGRARRGPPSDPLRVAQYGYITNVSFGTPPQWLTMLVDTGSANVFFPKKGCTGGGCGGSHAEFDTSKSSSYKAAGKFDMFDWCVGESAFETMGAAPGALLKGQQVGLCTQMEVGANGADGLWGLGPKLLEVDPSVVPTWETMKAQGIIDSARFAVAIDYKNPEKSELQWGDIDANRYTGELRYYPYQMYNGKLQYYIFEFSGLQIDGGAQLVGKADAMTDTGAFSLAGPSKDVARINAQLGVKKDCSNYGKLPSLKLTILGDVYEIPSDIYVIKTGRSCASAFEEGDDDFWLFGDPFFSAVFTVFDNDNRRYGMARNAALG